MGFSYGFTDRQKYFFHSEKDSCVINNRKEVLHGYYEPVILLSIFDILNHQLPMLFGICYSKCIASQ